MNKKQKSSKTPQSHFPLFCMEEGAANQTASAKEPIRLMPHETLEEHGFVVNRMEDVSHALNMERHLLPERGSW